MSSTEIPLSGDATQNPSAEPAATTAPGSGVRQIPEAAPNGQLIIGWREWVALPDINIPAIKVKVDTGARTSAIHAFDIQREPDDWVSFSVQPLQRNATIVRRCRAPVVDIRQVTDSGGHAEQRLFISTRVKIGSQLREVEMTLTERHNMLFRMLLGRTALVPDIIVDPVRSYVLGRLSARSVYLDQIEETPS